MIFISRLPCSKTWTVSVLKHFMINFTIDKAFAPYSPMCKENYIDFHNMDLDADPFDYICGHVYMETIYSKGNVLIVRIQSVVPSGPYPTSLTASYQVHTSGLAYKHSYIINCIVIIKELGNDYVEGTWAGQKPPFMPRSWEVNKQPSQLLFSRHQIKIIWYIANDAQDRKSVV